MWRARSRSANYVRALRVTSDMELDNVDEDVHLARTMSEIVRPPNGAGGAATVRLNSKQYRVLTQDKDSFYGTMFDGKRKPLCQFTSVRGCEKAVAVTSWHFDVGHGLYDDAGLRRPLDTHCDINVLMPVWVNAHGKEAKRVRRFLAATKTHEMGHGSACLSVMQVVQALMSHMPPRIAVDDVEAMNAAFALFVRDFYVATAHEVDHAYDDHTGHGGTVQGAQLGEDSSDDSGLDLTNVHKRAAAADAAHRASKRPRTRGGRKGSKTAGRRRRRRSSTSSAVSTRSTSGAKSSFLNALKVPI